MKFGEAISPDKIKWYHFFFHRKPSKFFILELVNVFRYLLILTLLIL